MYVGHTCASQATCNKSSCVGVQTYVGAYETTEECDAEYTRRADTATNEVGYCYNNNATECTKVKRSECNSNAGTQKFYYDSNENVAKNKCEDDNLEKDTYCYVANECKPNGNYPKTNVPTICHGTGQVISGHTDNKKECEKKIEEGGTNTGKYCYFGNVNGSPKCVQATIYEAKRNKCDTFRSEGGGGTGLPMITYSDGDGATPTSYADCQSKLVKCCMYKDKNGSHTCECSSSILTKDNKCINTSSSGSLVGGPYNSRADCDSHRPGELPKFKVDEPTEQLSHETLEKMNPLRHSLSNVFGNQSNRNPGYIISRLVKNIIFPISGLILFIQIIWAGFQVVQGGTTGNDNQVNSGKQRLISVIVGFLLLFASYWLWSLVELIFGIGIIEK